MPPHTEHSPRTGDPTQHTLALLWQRGLPRLRGRLEELDRAAAAALSGTLPPDMRHHAAATAHSLAGSLGMFGYMEGTNFAREIEVLLESPDDLDAVALQVFTIALRQSLEL